MKSIKLVNYSQQSVNNIKVWADCRLILCTPQGVPILLLLASHIFQEVLPQVVLPREVLPRWLLFKRCFRWLIWEKFRSWRSWMRSSRRKSRSRYRPEFRPQFWSFFFNVFDCWVILCVVCFHSFLFAFVPAKLIPNATNKTQSEPNSATNYQCLRLFLRH